MSRAMSRGSGMGSYCYAAVGRAQNGLFTSQHHWYGRARLVLTHGEASSPENSTRIRTPGSCPAYCGEVGIHT